MGRPYRGHLPPSREGPPPALRPSCPSIETDLYATVHEPAQDTAAGEIWTETFSAGSGVIYSFPLAAGGSWLIAPMRQTVAVSVPKGLTSTTYPDGTKVGVPHAPKVIHKAFYADTETAGIVDPAPGGVPSDDGFTGFPSSATAS